MFDWLSNLLGSGGGNASGGLSSTGAMDGPYSPTNPLGAGIQGFGAAGSVLPTTGSGVTGAIPGAAGAGAGATPLGLNLGTGQLAFGGLQALGNLWNAFQSSQMANKTFNFTKNLANTNLTNQTQAYNTNLEGQTAARYAQENKSPADALDFFNAHKLAQKTL